MWRNGAQKMGKCIKGKKGYMIYVDILTGEKLSSIWLANMDLFYWSVCLSRRRGGDFVKVVDGGHRFLLNQSI